MPLLVEHEATKENREKETFPKTPLNFFCLVLFPVVPNFDFCRRSRRSTVEFLLRAVGLPTHRLEQVFAEWSALRIDGYLATTTPSDTAIEIVSAGALVVGQSKRL